MITFHTIIERETKKVIRVERVEEYLRSDMFIPRATLMNRLYAYMTPKGKFYRVCDMSNVYTYPLLCHCHYKYNYSDWYYPTILIGTIGEILARIMILNNEYGAGALAPILLFGLPRGAPPIITTENVYEVSTQLVDFCHRYCTPKEMQMI